MTVGGAYVVQEYGEFWDAWQPDNTVEFRGGVIRIADGMHMLTSETRIDNPGLYILTDSSHICVGLTDVWIDVDTGYIMVATDGAWNGMVIATGDETAASQRLMFGASGGNPNIKVRCSDVNGPVDLADQATYTAVASNLLNAWVGFLSPGVRGIGDSSLTDRMMALEARVAVLEAR